MKFINTVLLNMLLLCTAGTSMSLYANSENIPLPEGSYKETCSDCKMTSEGNVKTLTCMCRPIYFDPVESKLMIDDDAEIVNCDGNLQKYSCPDEW